MYNVITSHGSNSDLIWLDISLVSENFDLNGAKLDEDTVSQEIFFLLSLAKKRLTTTTDVVDLKKKN